MPCTGAAGRVVNIADYCRRCLVDGSGPLVVKIGSSILIGEDGAARVEFMHRLAGALASRPGPVVVVSSGAIALGRMTLGMQARPTSLAEAQATAAVGQIQLAQCWAQSWAAHRRIAAQVLLTLGDLEDRARYLNARDTIETLLARNVVPVINENDTVATGEIRFGDNDRLAARVAQLVGAEMLLLLSDVDGLYDADPETSPGAKLIPTVEVIDADIERLAGSAGSTGFGTGGMVSKLAAARIATAAGCPVLLTSGLGDSNPIQRYLECGRGTVFQAVSQPAVRRKQWLRSLQQHEGVLQLDAGACRALEQGASLLAIGITGVEGRFQRGALVALIGPEGPIGQGLSGYDSKDLDRIKGIRSDRFPSILGYSGRGAAIHRDDLVLHS